MYKGIKKCTCGKEFYFETVRDTVVCLYCDEIHDVTSYYTVEESQGDDNLETDIRESKDL